VIAGGILLNYGNSWISLNMKKINRIRDNLVGGLIHFDASKAYLNHVFVPEFAIEPPEYWRGAIRG
jgi:hypothetical protein